MIDDAFRWFMLSIVSAMALGGVTTGKVATALLYLVLFVLASILVGRHVVRWVLRLCGDSEEWTIAAAVVMILLSAAATQALQLEAVFGSPW